MKETIVALTIVVIVSIAITMPVFAQTNQRSDSQEYTPGSTAGNITTPIKPQGTSIQAANDTSVSGSATASTAGNITTPIKPQGTSIQAANDTSVSGSATASTAGNITTMPIAPR
jgi:uncharacterized protein YdeI (BOF family)